MEKKKLVGTWHARAERSSWLVGWRGAAAGGRRERARGRLRHAELAEHVEKLRHGLPDAEGWARLAREAKRVPFAEQTPRRSEREPRDGRRRASRSLRRAY